LKWLFVDLTASTIDQLRRTCDALRQDPQLASLALSAPLQATLQGDRAA
jgi:hypothetical protein